MHYTPAKRLLAFASVHAFLQTLISSGQFVSILPGVRDVTQNSESQLCSGHMTHACWSLCLEALTQAAASHICHTGLPFLACTHTCKPGGILRHSLFWVVLMHRSTKHARYDRYHISLLNCSRSSVPDPKQCIRHQLRHWCTHDGRAWLSQRANPHRNHHRQRRHSACDRVRLHIRRQECQPAWPCQFLASTYASGEDTDASSSTAATVNPQEPNKPSPNAALTPATTTPASPAASSPGTTTPTATSWCT